MANELRIADETGLTYTCEVRQTDGTLVGSAVSLSESGSSGRYYGDFPSASAGIYDLLYIQSSIIEAAETVYWDGSAVLNLNDALTATGFSTFDHTTDEVITDEASRTASQADVSGLPTASEIVNALNAAEITVTIDESVSETGDLKITKNERLDFSFSGLSIPSDYGRCVLTIAKNLRDSDDEAILQADSTTGLLRLNGVSAGPSGASLTVDQPNGSVSGSVLVSTVAAIESATVLYYDVKHMSPTSGPKRVAQGRVIIEYTPGKTLS
ncbi:MAG: hypothetical protein AAF702_32980 [Chloroflexota bacterium]